MQTFKLQNLLELFIKYLVFSHCDPILDTLKKRKQISLNYHSLKHFKSVVIMCDKFLLSDCKEFYHKWPNLMYPFIMTSLIIFLSLTENKPQEMITK